MCRDHHEIYSLRVNRHTCSSDGCVGRCRESYVNGREVAECVVHMGKRSQDEGVNQGRLHACSDARIVASSMSSPQIPVGAPEKAVRPLLTSAQSDTTEPVDIDDPDLIPRLAINSKALNHDTLPHDRRPNLAVPDLREQGLRPRREFARSGEEVGFAGRISLSLRRVSRSRKIKSSVKLPMFLRKPAIRPNAPPVESESDLLKHRPQDDKFGRIIDWVETIADEGSNSTDDTLSDRVSKFPAFSVRGFGTVATHLGVGVYGKEL